MQDSFVTDERNLMPLIKTMDKIIDFAILSLNDIDYKSMVDDTIKDTDPLYDDYLFTDIKSYYELINKFIDMLIEENNAIYIKPKHFIILKKIKSEISKN